MCQFSWWGSPLYRGKVPAVAPALFSVVYGNPTGRTLSYPRWRDCTQPGILTWRATVTRSAITRLKACPRAPARRWDSWNDRSAPPAPTPGADQGSAAVQGRLLHVDAQRGNRRLAAHRQRREPATSHSCPARRTASRPAVAQPHSAANRSDCSPDGRAATKIATGGCVRLAVRAGV